MTLFGLFSKSKNKKLEKIKVLRDDVAWLEGFNLGFSKAWEMMMPLMRDGVLKMKDAIRDQAIDETLEGLESTILRRIEDCGNSELQSVNSVLAKKKDFEIKLNNSKSEDERNKYKNYIETINWVLNGNILQKT